MPKAHPADPDPTAEAGKPRPHDRRLRRLRHAPPDPEKYPNLKANRALERALLIQRALALGVPRDQAIRDADEHLAGPAGKPAEAPAKRPARAPGVQSKPTARTRVKPLP
ncbi:MAG TPA: hypothetical protein VM241_03240 [Candidatus Thermoplasmatota archaeon]|nr:hypothetical protein [Candidatus Thermoplasmatota archaeon]